MTKFIIVGAGRRVQQDLLPALSFLGYKKEDVFIFAKTKKNILVRNIIYDVKKFTEIKEIDDKWIVYIAVPANISEFIIDQVLETNPRVKIIIETPINNFLLVNKYNNYNICVAEDAYFLGKYLILNEFIKIKNFNILFMYKSAYSYHGIAFIESLLSKIFFGFSVFGIYFGICKKGIALIFGEKKYEAGGIWLNSKKLNLPELTESEKKLIGGYTDFDNLSYRFLDLKRIGLVNLINNFIKENYFSISISEGFNHYKKSKIIDKYNLKIIFKKVIKTALNKLT
tara:strand:- start:11988 stop:12839 length:852 start_codon:yes stop_codon:yes gene_type:complete